MPQWLDDVDDAGGARWPGTYERLLRRRCERETEPDPRLILVDEPGMRGEFEALQAAGRRRADELFTQRRAAGESIEAARCEVLGGRSGIPTEQAPEWLHNAKWVRVHADDTITAC